MRKQRLMSAVILLLAMMLFTGCGQRSVAGKDEPPGEAEASSQDQQTLSGTQEAAIKAAFLRQAVPAGEGFTADDLSVRYVCSFADACAAFIDGILDYSQAEKTETVNGLDFRYSDCHTMHFFRGGALYTLPEAFERGVIIAEELRQVYDAYREMASKQYEYPSCDGEDEAALKAAYLERFALEEEGFTADDVTVQYVCRFADGCAVFVDGGLMYPQMLTTETVNGLEFHYSTGHTMHFFRGGALYTLPEAFERGVITAEELRQVYDAYAAYGRGDGRDRR